MRTIEPRQEAVISNLNTSTCTRLHGAQLHTQAATGDPRLLVYVLVTETTVLNWGQVNYG
jgi:hypothetical protein